MRDPVKSLVECGVGDDIETVIIDGKIVMENRRIPGLDIEEYPETGAGVRRKSMGLIAGVGFAWPDSGGGMSLLLSHRAEHERVTLRLRAHRSQGRAKACGERVRSNMGLARFPCCYRSRLFDVMRRRRFGQARPSPWSSDSALAELPTSWLGWQARNSRRTSINPLWLKIASVGRVMSRLLTSRVQRRMDIRCSSLHLRRLLPRQKSRR